MDAEPFFVSLRNCLVDSFRVAVPPETEAGLNGLLDRVTVGHNTVRGVGLEVRPGWTFDELVDHCRIALLRAGTANALTDGFRLANSHASSAAVHAQSSKLANSLLKNNDWRLLYHCIGNAQMAKLLTNYSAYEQINGRFVHLFGESLKKTQYKPYNSLTMLSLDPAMYKESHITQYLKPISDSPNTLMTLIFKEEYSKSSNKVPAKLKGFAALASTIINNHNKRHYHAIFKELCTCNTSQSRDTPSYATPKDKVMNFVTTVVYMVFPLSVFGTKSNRTKLIGCLSRLVNGDKGFKMSIDQCLSGIKTGPIIWLDKSTYGVNKQAMVKRERLLRQFVEWFIGEFFVKLLGSFFHITHVSSGKSIYFFNHSTWKELSLPYLTSYVSENLMEVSNPDSISQSESTKILQSFLRVMPKKNEDFRAISVPERGSDPKQLQLYNEHLRREIRPSKWILNRIRLSDKSSHFLKLASVSQIPLQLSVFKKNLEDVHSQVPNLFFLKFDAESCYDTLPQSKIMDLVSKMVDPDELYYYSEATEVELGSLKSKQIKSLGNLRHVIDREHASTSTSLADSEGRHVLKGQEVIDVCRMQLKGTITKASKRTYLRRKGVFQGIHMSSLFCDLVYDSLIEEEFGFLANSNSLVLRIADDFLIISSEVGLLMRMRTLASAGFPAYGVKINELKTAVNFGSQSLAKSTFKFCGYDIDIGTLDIIKRYDHRLSFVPHVKSHRVAVSRMSGIFKVRLRQNTLNTFLTSPQSIIKQLHLLSSNVAVSYCKTVKSIKISAEGFSHFFKEIILEATKVKGPLATSELRRSIGLTILTIFLEELVKHDKRKFRGCVEYLRREQKRMRL